MKKSRVWVFLVFAVLGLSLLSSCATYKVAKEKVLIPAKSLVIAAGPELVTALIQDISGLLGWPFEQGESLFSPAVEEKKAP